MTRIEEIMVETYYTLIKGGRRTAVPDHVPTEVKQAVAARLDADKVTTNADAVD